MRTCVYLYLCVLQRVCVFVTVCVYHVYYLYNGLKDWVLVSVNRSRYAWSFFVEFRFHGNRYSKNACSYSYPTYCSARDCADSMGVLILQPGWWDTGKDCVDWSPFARVAWALRWQWKLMNFRLYGAEQVMFLEWRRRWQPLAAALLVLYSLARQPALYRDTVL